jgi:hypothetical protein
MKNRLLYGVLLGAFLGVFCVIGIGIRMGDQVSGLFLFATWFNRVVIGLMIGLYKPASQEFLKAAFRGGVLGLIVSFSLYSATAFIDTPGLFAGIFYGIIIDTLATKFSR